MQLVIALVTERVVLRLEPYAALAFRLSIDTADAVVPVEADNPDKKCGLGSRLEKLPFDPFM